jgi:predicted small metal-binding protein
MAKELRCGDLMPGCQAVVEGKDEAEVMAKAAEHAKTAHGLQQIPPELASKVRSGLRKRPDLPVSWSAAYLNMRLQRTRVA